MRSLLAGLVAVAALLAGLPTDTHASGALDRIVKDKTFRIVVEIAPPEAIFTRPAHGRTAAFLGKVLR